jgi:predicted O-methyltransferase YrrM
MDQLLATTREVSESVGAAQQRLRDQAEAVLRDIETRLSEADRASGPGGGKAGKPGKAEAEVRPLLANLERLVREFERHRARDVTRQTTQIEAMHNLYAMADVGDVLPPLGGWAANADLLRLLVDQLLSLRPKVVLECGSGASTVWMGLLARQYGLDTRIVALEHDEAFARATSEMLRRHHLEEHAEVRHAPLTDTGLEGHDTPWYDVSVIAELNEIGLLFVDGPPARTGDQARLPAVPLLRDRFAADCTIILDDYVRDEEKETAVAWRGLLDDFDFREADVERGAAVFSRSSAGA